LIFRKRYEGEWTGLIWLRWALVNAVLNLQVPENAGNSLTENQLASPEELCSMK